ncbi:hypothetical protein DPMN_191128 [Dreissena polymorpha]|uniref:Uncharacterized protein n=1 Tax=Dreissena polymorpha TaxID=45954 RepID=A0A9D3XWY9_DREPO|nr:hypothetical protein DPMN_191128 [Dreissena polymorpha]
MLQLILPVEEADKDVNVVKTMIADTIESGDERANIDKCLNDLKIEYVMKYVHLRNGGVEQTYTSQNVPIRDEDNIRLRNCIWTFRTWRLRGSCVFVKDGDGELVCIGIAGFLQGSVNCDVSLSYNAT